MIKYESLEALEWALELLCIKVILSFVSCFCQTPVDTEDVQPAPNIDHLLLNIGRAGLLGEISGESLPNLFTV